MKGKESKMPSKATHSSQKSQLQFNPAMTRALGRAKIRARVGARVGARIGARKGARLGARIGARKGARLGARIGARRGAVMAALRTPSLRAFRASREREFETQLSKAQHFVRKNWPSILGVVTVGIATVAFAAKRKA
jgi:hypothetical protein